MGVQVPPRTPEHKARPFPKTGRAAVYSKQCYAPAGGSQLPSWGSQAMDCPGCGGRVGKNARFCAKCGAELVQVGDETGSVAADVVGEGSEPSPGVAEEAAERALVDAAENDAAVEEPAQGSEAPALTLTFALTQRRKIILAAVAGGLLVVAVAGALISSGIQARKQEQAQARTRAEQLAKKKASNLNAAFDQFMALRAQALAAEATINNQVVAAKAKRVSYQKAATLRLRKIKSNTAAYKHQVAAVSRHNSDQTPFIGPLPMIVLGPALAGPAVRSRKARSPEWRSCPAPAGAAPASRAA
jgi:hypothetical protein